jgi:hypothetical protein
MSEPSAPGPDEPSPAQAFQDDTTLAYGELSAFWPTELQRRLRKLKEIEGLPLDPLIPPLEKRFFPTREEFFRTRTALWRRAHLTAKRFAIRQMLATSPPSAGAFQLQTKLDALNVEIANIDNGEE